MVRWLQRHIAELSSGHSLPMLDCLYLRTKMKHTTTYTVLLPLLLALAPMLRCQALRRLVICGGQWRSLCPRGDDAAVTCLSRGH